MATKFRILISDFIPHFRKFPINEKDKEGKELYFGDTVIRNEEKYLIGYRYGKVSLLPIPLGIHSIQLKDYSHLEQLQQLTAVHPDGWLIIGYKDEPLFEDLKHLDKVQYITSV